MTYVELLHRINKHYDAGEARAVLRLLLEKRFGLSWTEVLCGAMETLSSEQQNDLESLTRQLEAGIPVQYALGEADFLGRSFHVEEGVLIPRPETELLVQYTIESVKNMDQVRLLDIGTGSGCIALSLALENESWQVEGWDISDKALKIARVNAEKHRVGNVLFRNIDILHHKNAEEGIFTAIVSNPPYICNKERAQMESHVLDHEPALALFVPDEDPLLFYRVITLMARHSLLKNGSLLFEINREYGQEVAQLMMRNGFTDVNIIKDQFDNDRIVKGRKL